MHMEIVTPLPTLLELYALYGVQESSSQAYTSSWEVPRGFGEELTQMMTDIAARYVPRSLPPFPYTGPESPAPDVPHEELLLHQSTLTCDTSVTCRVVEMAGISSVAEREKKQWALRMRLTKNDAILCDSFLLHENRGLWNFSHRLVPSVFRGKRLFTHFSAAQEAFVEQRAEAIGQRQVIYLTTGQPDVSLAFLKRGYRPSSEDDTRKIDRMLHPDGSLMLAYARKPKMLSGGNEHECIDADMTSLYCFEKEKTPTEFIMGNALRIRLEKSFDPSDPFRSHKQATIAGITNVITQQ